VHKGCLFIPYPVTAAEITTRDLEVERPAFKDNPGVL
jgi:hypothetical protein